MNTKERQAVLVQEQRMLREHLLGQLSTLDGEAWKMQRTRLQQDPEREDWASLFAFIEHRPEKHQLKRLMQVEASLSLIDQDMYGICADCEETIEPATLQVDPTAQYCDTCFVRNQQICQQQAVRRLEY